MKNWIMTIDEEKIAWLYFDNENNKVNILRTAVVKELDEILDTFKNKPPRALIILSKKEAGFCVGADIHEFSPDSDLSLIREYVAYGQGVMQKLADLPFPTLALVHGLCLGGGLELSLACHYRIAQLDSAQMGLPEVRLGVQPAWGGSVRLPQLIHPLKAMNMLLTGHTVNARIAKKIGLVNDAVPQRQMLNAARLLALQGIRKHKFNLRVQSLFQPALIRRLAAIFMRKQVQKQAQPQHYPAPFTIIDHWQQFGAQGALAYAAEIDGFIKLLETNSTKNLVRIFFLQEQLKNSGKQVNWRAQHIHVIGAGTMGGDIAAWCAKKGLTVTLQDRTAQDLCRAMKRAHELCPDKYMLDKLIPDIAGDGIAHADIVLEAVFENLAVKQALLSDIADKIKPGAIVATNTSSISLAEIKQGFKHADQLVGIHFFNPVAKMQLVEVVHTDEVNPIISEQALAFVHQIGKLPLKVKDSPGFLVNRVIAPYLLETVHLIEEGVPMQHIDKAAKDFGMVMGPVMMINLVGLDICMAAVKNLGQQTPKVLADKIAAGHLGKKSGEGFYLYKHGKAQALKTSMNLSSEQAQEIQDRLILTLINECVACLGEGIVSSSDEVDAGIIFGMGFAPFLGGPLQYAKQLGFENIYDKLKGYEKSIGPRFAPKVGWDRYIKP